ncbi:MAG: helix-turn-helix domain-containing protein [Gammaproteobacteria bacterium]|nr:helix-turn-helix domain-containing protein [Gammaproteobacteria bacterium]
MKFNEKLKYLREKNNYTQEEIASKLNIARQSVSKWELAINEPDFETLKKLCNILNCSIEELIDDDKTVEDNIEDKREKRAKIVFYFNIAVIIFFSLIVLLMLSIAKGDVIKHWDANFNKIYGSKWNLLLSLLAPAICLIAAITYRLLVTKKNYYKRFELSFSIFSLILSIILCIGGLILSIFMIDGNYKENILPNITIAIALAIITTLGLFSHPSINKRNVLLGFRTDFTISNEEAWIKVNSFSSILLSISAIISYILVLIFIDRVWDMAFISIILIGVIITFIYHEILRKKMKN